MNDIPRFLSQQEAQKALSERDRLYQERRNLPRDPVTGLLVSGFLGVNKFRLSRINNQIAEITRRLEIPGM